MAVFMEKRTTKDNTNSSLPSSQTEKDDTATSRRGAKAKGKSHDDHRCANTRTIETTQVVKVRRCHKCGD